MTGQTLHQILEKGAPLPPGQVVRIALHLSHLVGDAHRKGKTYGGIYPDQVRIDQEGQVNLFELAAPRLPEDVTLSYLCFVPPELLDPAGGGATQQSDLYSFGIIIFSLLTGHVPFSAGTREDLTHQILDSRMEPIPNLPGEFNQLNWILRKCLLRIPSRRFANGDELALELRQISGGPRISIPKKISVSASAAQVRKIQAFQFDYRELLENKKLLAIIGGSLLALILIIVFFATRESKPKMTAIRSWDTRAYVAEPDLDLAGSLSSKDALAFVSNRTGNFDIYIGSPSAPDQLTQSPGTEENPRWSPDGEQILYTYREGTKPAMIFTLPPSGGIPQKLVEDAMDGSWSPDGQSICYVSPASKASRNLVIRDYISGTTRTILENQKGLASPSFSFNGKEIVVEADQDSHPGLMIVNVKSGTVKTLSKKTDDESPAWDWTTGAIYFVSQHSIWRMNDSGKREQITSGFQDSHPVPSYAGQPILFQRQTLLHDIMSIDPATLIKKNESPEPGNSYFPRSISEAKSMIYLTSNSDGASLKCAISGSSTTTVIPKVAPDAGMSISPEGASVYLRQDSKKGLWQVAVVTGGAKSVGDDIVLPYEVSLDRKQLLYGKASGNEIFYLNRNLKTNEEEELLHVPQGSEIQRAYWQDPSTIIFLTNDSHLVSFSTREKTSTPIISEPCLDFSVRPKSTTIAALIGHPEKAELILYDLHSGKRTSLTRFTPDEFSKHLDWSKDGSVLFFDRYKTNTDIYAATGR